MNFKVSPSSSPHQGLGADGVRYLTVGSIGFTVDFTLFNVLLIAGFGATSELALAAKSLAVVAGTGTTYFLNSRWTFAGRSGHKPGYARALRYSVVSLLGLSVTLLPLYVAREVLGYSSVISDNLAASFVGPILGLSLRFVLSRHWVFRDQGPRYGPNFPSL